MSDVPKNYRRILWTWLTWWPFGAVVVLLAVALAVELTFDGWKLFASDVFSPWRSGMGQPLAMIGNLAGYALLIAPVVIAWGVKRQVTDRNAVLTGQDRRSHLVVAAVIFATIGFLVICVPMVLMLIIDRRVLMHSPPHMYPGWSWQSEFRRYWQNGLGIVTRELLVAALVAGITVWRSPWAGILLALVLQGDSRWIERCEPAVGLLFTYTGTGHWMPQWRGVPNYDLTATAAWFALAICVLVGLWRQLAGMDGRGEAAPGMRAGRYRQVWAAWLNWRAFQVALGLMAFECWLWVTNFSNYGGYNGSGWFAETMALLISVVPMLLVVGLPVMLVWRVMLHLGDWRSSLIPGHRRAHLAVFTVIAAGIFVLMICVPVVEEWVPVKLSEISLLARSPRAYEVDGALYPYSSLDWSYAERGYRPDPVYLGGVAYRWGNLALTLLLVTVVGWVAVWGWLALGAILMVLAASAPILLVLGRNAWIGQIQDRWASDASLLPVWLGLDACLLAGLWFRLWRIRGSGRDGRADDHAAWLSLFLVGFKHLPAGGLRGAGLWRRAGHRRAIGLGRRFCVILAAYLAALVAVSPLVAADSGWLDHLGYSFAALVIAAITSSLAVGLAWPQRFAALGDVELLRPAAREGFVQEMGLAMLCDMAEISVLTLAAVLIPIAFWSPGAIHSAVFWSAAMAAMLSQALAFGVIAWMLSRRVGPVSIGVLMLVIGTTVVLIHQALDDRRIMPAVVAAVMGVALTIHAYHRWAKVDML